MAGSVNRVLLVGNLARDPEVRAMSNGGKVVNMTVVTSEKWKDKSGQDQERAEFNRVVIFNEHLAKVAQNYLKKGSTVYIEGQLQTRKWTDLQGAEKYTTEIVLQKYRGELTMLGGSGGEAPSGGFGDDQTRSYGREEIDKARAPMGAADLEDQTPF